MDSPPRAAPIRRSRAFGFAATILVAMIAAVLIFTVSRLSLGGASSARPTPAALAVMAFYHAVSRQDYATAYMEFAPQQQALITSYSFKLAADLLDGQQGVVTAYTTLRADRDTNATNQMIVQEQVTRTKKGTYTVMLTVAAQSDGSWKIASESGV